MYHFISGYTAKVAGTERGITEPQATFSACFGAPFMVHHSGRLRRHPGEEDPPTRVKTWLVNTGWTGGPYGVGRRMDLAYTRAMVDAALNDALDGVPLREDSVFGLSVPITVPGVPDDILDPRATWSDQAAYGEQAAKLAGMFVANFATYADLTSAEVREAGPRASS